MTETYRNIIDDINTALRTLYVYLNNERPELIKYYPDSNETFVLFPNNHAFNMNNFELGFVSAFSFAGRSEMFDNVLLYRMSSKGQQRGPLDLYVNDNLIAQQFYSFLLDILMSQMSDAVAQYIDDKEAECLQKEDEFPPIPRTTKNNKRFS